MLPTNFAKLAADKPEIRSPLKKIQEWCTSHRSAAVIDPRRLAHETAIDPVLITKAMFFLVEKGVFEQVYRFETPAGYLLSDDFKSFLDVPETMYDRYDNVVHRWEGEVVPVFRGNP